MLSRSFCRSRHIHFESVYSVPTVMAIITERHLLLSVMTAPPKISETERIKSGSLPPTLSSAKHCGIRSVCMWSNRDSCARISQGQPFSVERVEGSCCEMQSRRVLLRRVSLTQRSTKTADSTRAADAQRLGSKRDRRLRDFVRT
jgi:hypothetical protein